MIFDFGYESRNSGSRWAEAEDDDGRARATRGGDIEVSQSPSASQASQLATARDPPPLELNLTYGVTYQIRGCDMARGRPAPFNVPKGSEITVRGGAINTISSYSPTSKERIEEAL